MTRLITLRPTNFKSYRNFRFKASTAGSYRMRRSINHYSRDTFRNERSDQTIPTVVGSLSAVHFDRADVYIAKVKSDNIKQKIADRKPLTPLEADVAILSAMLAPKSSTYDPQGAINLIALRSDVSYVKTLLSHPTVAVYFQYSLSDLLCEGSPALWAHLLSEVFGFEVDASGHSRYDQISRILRRTDSYTAAKILHQATLDGRENLINNLFIYYQELHVIRPSETSKKEVENEVIQLNAIFNELFYSFNKDGFYRDPDFAELGESFVTLTSVHHHAQELAINKGVSQQTLDDEIFVEMISALTNDPQVVNLLRPFQYFLLSCLQRPTPYQKNSFNRFVRALEVCLRDVGQYEFLEGTLKQDANNFGLLIRKSGDGFSVVAKDETLFDARTKLALSTTKENIFDDEFLVKKTSSTITKHQPTFYDITRKSVLELIAKGNLRAAAQLALFGQGSAVDSWKNIVCDLGPQIIAAIFQSVYQENRLVTYITELMQHDEASHFETPLVEALALFPLKEEVNGNEQRTLNDLMSGMLGLNTEQFNLKSRQAMLDLMLHAYVFGISQVSEHFEKAYNSLIPNETWPSYFEVVLKQNLPGLEERHQRVTTETLENRFFNAVRSLESAFSLVREWVVIELLELMNESAASDELKHRCVLAMSYLLKMKYKSISESKSNRVFIESQTKERILSELSKHRESGIPKTALQREIAKLLIRYKQPGIILATQIRLTVSLQKLYAFIERYDEGSLFAMTRYLFQHLQNLVVLDFREIDFSLFPMDKVFIQGRTFTIDGKQVKEKDCTFANIRLDGKQVKEICRQFAEQGLDKKVNLFGADLQEADLSEVDLSRVELEYANLRGAKLPGNCSGVSFANTDLHRAEVIHILSHGGSIKGACLRDADLSGLDLSKANLMDACLIRANLQGTKLPEDYCAVINFTRARLGRAEVIHILAQGGSIKGADLREADLSGMDFSRADLERVNLEEANLENSNLEEANLRGANLFRARLTGANFQRANLKWANFPETDLSGVDLTGAIFEDVPEDNSPNIIPEDNPANG